MMSWVATAGWQVAVQNRNSREFSALFCLFYDVFTAGTKRLPLRAGPGQRHTKVRPIGLRRSNSDLGAG
jgi:hypothetical protein